MSVPNRECLSLQVLVSWWTDAAAHHLCWRGVPSVTAPQDRWGTQDVWGRGSATAQSLEEWRLRIILSLAWFQSCSPQPASLTYYLACGSVRLPQQGTEEEPSLAVHCQWQASSRSVVQDCIMICDRRAWAQMPSCNRKHATVHGCLWVRVTCLINCFLFYWYFTGFLGYTSSLSFFFMVFFALVVSLKYNALLISSQKCSCVNDSF